MNLLKYARILKLCSYIKIGLFKINKINSPELPTTTNPHNMYL